MGKMTVLEMTQDILNDMGSDNVNSIDDTEEATIIANIIKSTYFEIINDREWPHLKTLMQLEASGTTSRPTHMKIPENCQSIEWVKYDKIISTATASDYKTITRKEPEEFLDFLNTRDEDDTDVSTIYDDSSVKLLIRKDQAPIYWTSFDDEYIVFDAYDSTVDSTLQQAKTQVWGYREPTFTVSDTHTPDLPSKAFPYLLAESKSSCFEKVAQEPSAKEEQKARRQRTFLSVYKWRQNGGIKKPDYGRKR